MRKRTTKPPSGGKPARTLAKDSTTKGTKKAAKRPRKASKPRGTEKTGRVTRPRDPRLPPVGTEIVRPYKGKDVRVTVREDGFEYDGVVYPSLTRTAMVVTGYKAISGPAFFRITERKERPPKAAKRSRGRTSKAATPGSTPAQDLTAAD